MKITLNSVYDERLDLFYNPTKSTVMIEVDVDDHPDVQVNFFRFFSMNPNKLQALFREEILMGTVINAIEAYVEKMKQNETSKKAEK